MPFTAATHTPRGGNGKVFVAIPRAGHVQIARLIPKGVDERLRAEGIEALQRVREIRGLMWDGIESVAEGSARA